MTRPFRFAPPELPPDSVVRTRVLRALLARWERRLVVVSGGPGLGKTTALAQALAENRLDSRGTDVWLGIDPTDSGGDRLAIDLLAALGANQPIGSPGPEEIAHAVWRRAPEEVALVLDDIHQLDHPSGGLALVQELLSALPVNGHLVLTGRVLPELSYARLAAAGEVLELGEDDLRFDDEEAVRFARSRDLDPAALEEAGGWPALCALAASAGAQRVGDFVWQEVLEPLGADRRRVLGMLCELGGADDDLGTVALGVPVDLASATRGVPLLARDAHGWHAPHPLWRTVRLVDLSDDQRAEIRRRGVGWLVEHRRLDSAFDLVADHEMWDLAPAVLRAACLGGVRPVLAQLDRWLRRCPETVAQTPAGRMAVGVATAMRGQPRAGALLREAASGFRVVGDVDGELAALAHLGRFAWWRQDLTVLGEIAPRIHELAAEGHGTAIGLDLLGRALLHDISGEIEAALAQIDAIEPGWLDPAWTAVVLWMRAALRGWADPGSASALDAAVEIADPVFRLTVEHARFLSRWCDGQIERCLRDGERLLLETERAGVAQNVAGGAADAARCHAYLGDVERARKLLDRARAAGVDTPNVAARVAAATAAVQVAMDDEAAATATLRAALSINPLETGRARVAWRDSLALIYVLLPESRPTWDEAPIDPYLRWVRSLAQVVVARREAPGEHEGPSPASIETLDVSDIGRLRAAVHVCHLAELAMSLHGAGSADGARLLEALGPPGRAATRAVAGREGSLRNEAATLLTAVPAPPPVEIALRVLGPLELLQSGEVASPPELRRERVRTLLAFLVVHPSTTREAVMATLWPDLDERSAANNLRVTLNYAVRALEPWRSDGDPSHLLRSEGARLTLRIGDLGTDIGAFERQISAAAEAEASGAPSLALDHHLEAVTLYRGDLFEDVVDAVWVDLDREHYRTRFVASGSRAAQLLVARGDTEHAEAVARRVLAVDPWCEAAHGVLVDAALERRDRAAAHRRMQRCLEVLGELGVEPSEDLRRLQRRIYCVSP